MAGPSQALQYRISIIHREKHFFSRLEPASLSRRLATVSQVLKSKEDPGNDIQEDSSADKEALQESRQTAKQAEGVEAESPHNPDVRETAQFDPEVSDKSGKGFPHQTAEQRNSRLASTTEGEAPVKTREYTPKEGTHVYPEKGTE